MKLSLINVLGSCLLALALIIGLTGCGGGNSSGGGGGSFGSAAVTLKWSLFPRQVRSVTVNFSNYPESVDNIGLEFPGLALPTLK